MTELNISYALRKLQIKLKYSDEEIMRILNVTKKSLDNYKIRHTNPTPQIINKIISLIENNKLNIYDLLDIEQDDGYLFHGSKTGGLIGKISTLINKNEPNDFVNGFYLSDSLRNAVSYVIDQNKPIIYRFKREDVLKGKIYDFSSMKNGEIDWIIYIGLYRRKILNEDDERFFKEYYDEKFSNFDVLTGEIADSYNFDVLNDFFNNLKDLDETRKALLLANIGTQFVMKNEKYANDLQWSEVYVIERNLKNYLVELVKTKRTVLKKNRNDISSNHIFDKVKTFENVKRKIKEEYEQRRA